MMVGYHKYWYARARAKVMLHEDGADHQYKRVYDYENAVRIKRFIMQRHHKKGRVEFT